jgi:pyruvate dehydrogenase E2 component (dihydrolipoamide acetyltransferase)
MSTNVTMPSMGFDMTEGKVSRWLKNIGDAVERGQVIGEIETEKATVDLEAPVAGTLTQILVEAGNTVPVNTPIAVIGAAGEATVAEPAAPAAQAQAQEAKTAPEAEPDQPAAQPSSPEKETAQKADAPAAKAKTKAVAAATPPPASDKQKESAPPSATETPSQESGTPSAVARPSEPVPADDSNGRIKASPVARNMAKSEGIELSAIQGTGPGGRIIERDVLAAIQARGDKPTAPAAPAAKPAPTQAPAAAPAPAELATGEQPLSKMRQVIARRLVESKTTIPHFYLTMEIFMDEAMKLRQQLNAMVTNDAEKLSVNDLIVAAAARTLRHYPFVNGYFKGDKLELHDTINVGIAVSVDDGLLTPVLHDVDHKSLKQNAVEAKEAAARARANKLKPSDLGPGTFTVSNLGMYGIKEFAAIINPPESSILAVGAVQKVPVVLDDEIKIAQVMQVTLSCDHRIVDGALGARFLQDLKKLLENPVNLLV